MRWAIRVSGVAIAAACGLSGCLLGPDYTRPEQALDDAYYQPAQKGATVANLGWWEFFSDPVLQNLIRQCLNENKNLKVAAARVERARALLGFTRADQFPRLDLSGNAVRTRSSKNFITNGKNPFNDFGIFGDLSFEIDFWGKLHRATEAEQATLLSTEYAHRAVIVTLVSQVATAYFRILGLEDRLKISDETIKNRSSNTGLIRARFSKGVVPELDVNQAEIEEASARADRLDFLRDLRQTEHALSVLLGTTPKDIPRGQGLYEQTLQGDVPVGFPAELLERRPDVLSAEEAVRAEVARVGVATANRLPTLDLLGFIGLQSEKASDFFEGDSFTWSIGGSLLGPIVDFGKSRSAQEAQEAAAEAALHSYEQTVLQAVQEVDDSLIAIQTASDAYLQRTSQTKAARNAARLSHARYDEGVTSYLEVLDIERSLFEAELGASINREQYLTSIVLLYKALGGGWRDDSASGGAPKGEAPPLRPW